VIERPPLFIDQNSTRRTTPAEPSGGVADHRSSSTHVQPSDPFGRVTPTHVLIGLGQSPPQVPFCGWQMRAFGTQVHPAASAKQACPAGQSPKHAGKSSSPKTSPQGWRGRHRPVGSQA